MPNKVNFTNAVIEKDFTIEHGDIVQLSDELFYLVAMVDDCGGALYSLISLDFGNRFIEPLPKRELVDYLKQRFNDCKIYRKNEISVKLGERIN